MKTKCIANRFLHHTESETDPPPFDYLQSAAELKVRGFESENTRGKDWNKLGNTAFTFFLIAIDGIRPKREFLDDTTHFAEYNIEEIESLWVSADLIKYNDKKLTEMTAFKGSGSNVKIALAQRVSRILHERKEEVSSGSVLGALERIMPFIEVKIPGGIAVSKWQKS